MLQCVTGKRTYLTLLFVDVRQLIMAAHLLDLGHLEPLAMLKDIAVNEWTQQTVLVAFYVVFAIYKLTPP